MENYIPITPAQALLVADVIKQIQDFRHGNGAGVVLTSAECAQLISLKLNLLTILEHNGELPHQKEKQQ